MNNKKNGLSNGLRSRMGRFAMALGLVTFAAVGGCAEAVDGVSEENAVGADEAREDGDPAGTDARIQKGGAGASCVMYASGTGPLGGPNSVEASCRKRNGDDQLSQAWLPGCMGNDGGRLVWGGRYFDRSCHSCTIRHYFNGRVWIPSTLFECQCANRNGNYNHTQIDLNQHLTNNDGFLICD